MAKKGIICVLTLAVLQLAIAPDFAFGIIYGPESNSTISDGAGIAILVAGIIFVGIFIY